MQAFAEPELELYWGTVYGASIDEMLQAAAQNKTPAIAITPAQFAPLERHPGALGRVRRTMEELGVRVSVIDPLCRCLPGVPDAGALEPRVSWMVEYDEDFCFGAAEALGIETVNLAHFRGSKLPLKNIADATRRVCERAARKNLRVTFEFFPESGVPNLQTAVDLVAMVATPNFGIMFDVLHFCRSGGQVNQLEQLPPGIIGGIQLSDRKEPPPGAPYVPMTGRCLPGDGDLPLHDILLRLLPQCPGIPVGVEIFSAELHRMLPVEATRLAMDATRRLLDGVQRAAIGDL